MYIYIKSINLHNEDLGENPRKSWGERTHSEQTSKRGRDRTRVSGTLRRRWCKGFDKVRRDRGTKAEDRNRHRLSAPVVYSLLGLSMLLSAAALCVAVILFGAVIKIHLGLKSPEQDVHSCPEQWTKFQQSCYNFSSSSKTWVEAQRSCASAAAHLVVINNAEEQGFLKKHVDVIRWIGLSDSASEGDWRWVDGTDYISSVKFWGVGEPNNKRVERCVEMLGVGRWNDQECSDLQRWICEKPAE